FEIIVVDDGSQDQTLAKARALLPELKVKLLGFSRNFGKEIALTAGLDHCNGKVIVLIDGDYQHPIDMIKAFLDQWGNGFDMVYGVRTNRDNESGMKRNFARLFYWIMGKITKINIPTNAGDFRLMDRKVVDSLKNFHERTRFMKGLFAYVGFKKIAVPYDVRERAAGKSSLGFSRLTELAITGITSFSDAPLRVWGFVGFIISVISFLYAIYIMTMTLIFGTDLPGFPTLAVAIIFFGGIQLMSIGILGEYIARIFTEVKQRPNYIIETKEGFSEDQKS
ncbi:MAG TPA: glycosyltransferase family 2 protein, partial [Gammaproteobacteria bacterium]|nr:glycosyltransferase family 2 protein [Gammaproteobacteria bacterium]